MSVRALGISWVLWSSHVELRHSNHPEFADMTGFFAATPPHPFDLARQQAVRRALEQHAVYLSGDTIAQIVVAAHEDLPEVGRQRAVNTVLTQRAVYLSTDTLGKIVAAARLSSSDWLCTSD
ncbi:hypothetical protein CE206_28975 (plasmid) [Achromobacter xylosoxidans]|nr:hypothetical protein CE206_28975 [Achromobacter xylosoxidans]